MAQIEFLKSAINSFHGFFEKKKANAKDLAVENAKSPNLASSVTIDPKAVQKGKLGNNVSSVSFSKPTNSIEAFEQTINQVLKSSQKSIPPEVIKAINEKQAELKSLLEQDIKNLDDVKKINDNILVLSRQFNTIGVFNARIKCALNNVIQSFLDKTGDKFGLQLKLETTGDEILGVKCQPKEGNKLTKEQKQCLNNLAEMCSKLEKIQSFKTVLTPESILLLGIREELLRRSFEACLPFKDDGSTGQPDFKDLGIISNALKTIDTLLDGTRKIPSNLIADLEKTVSAMTAAPLGQIGEALNNVGKQTAPAQPGSLNISIPGNIAEFPDKIHVNSPEIPFSKAIKNNDLSDNSQLNNASNMLLGIIKGAPHDFSKNVGEVINAYSQVMNIAEAHLPPLYFPITLPVPLAYNDGKGNKFFLPAGSQLSQKNGDYIINSPGTLMQSGNTIIQSTNSTIKLGKGEDELAFNKLSVVTSDYDLLMTGFTGKIDRQNNSAIIHADETYIDLTNGKVNMTNANIIHNPGSTQINASSFFYEQGENRTGLTDFNLGQTTTNGVSTIAGSANNLDIKSKDTLIKADSISFNMIQDKNSQHPDTARLNVQNLDLKTGSNSFQAASSTVDIVTNKDGSSLMTFNANDVNWNNPNESLKTTGASTITLNQDVNGNVTDLKAQTEDLTYQDKNGVFFNAKNTDITINYGADGKVSSLSGKTDSFDFKNQTDQVSANGANIDLIYSSNGFLKTLTAKSDSVNYIGEKGKLDVTGGNLALNYDKNGKLNSFDATTDKINWIGKSGESLDASKTSLNMNFYENGKLSKLNTTMGDLNFITAKGDAVNVINGAAEFTFNPNGKLNNATGSADSLNFNGINGDVLKTNGINVGAKFGENGNIQNISASSGNIDYQGKAGKLVTNGKTAVDLAYNANGTISSLNASTEDARFTGNNFDVHALSGALKLGYDSNGVLQNINGSTQNLEVNGAWGQFIADGKTELNLNYSGKDKLSNINVSAEHLKYTKGDTALDLKGTSVNLNYNDNGYLSSATGAIKQGTYTGSFGTVQLQSGGKLELNYGNDGNLSNIKADIASLTYTGDKGNFGLKGGQADAVYGADGKLQSFQIRGDSVNFAGKITNDQPLNVSFNNFNVSFLSEDKGQTLKFTGKDGNLDIQGNKLNVENIQNLEIRSNNSGSITGVDVDLRGTTRFKKSDGDLTASLKNFQGHYSKDNSNLSISFDDLDVKLKSQGLSVHATDTQAQYNNEQLRVHVGSAEILKQIGQEMQVEVEGLDLVLDKTAQGGIKGLDVQIEGLDAKVSGMDVMIKTKNGDRVRVNVTMSDDGKMLQEAFLQIPSGGEIKIENQDFKLALGPQTIKFTQDGQGVYTFRDDGLKINYITKDAKVQVQGGSAQVKLDTKNGDLIIEEFRGTKIHAEVGGQKVDVDVKQLDGFLLKMTGVSGLAHGAAIHLQPTGDNSAITAQIRTKVNGIPIYVKFNNLHELKMLGYVQKNEFYVYAGDPSNRGDIQIGAGPLKLEGSAIEFIGKYHTYNPHLMLSTISRYLSTDGIKYKCMSIEPDGVVRMGTTKPGIHAELAIFLPRPTTMSTPNYPMNAGINDGAAGAIGSLGWHAKTEKGIDYTGTVFAGVVPGSYFTLDQRQGAASVFGVQLPNHLAVPTTGVGGVGFRRETDKSKLDAAVGGYVNPASMAPKNVPIEEQKKYGGFAGVAYRKNNWQIGLDTVLDINKDNKVIPGVRVGIGVSF